MPRADASLARIRISVAAPSEIEDELAAVTVSKTQSPIIGATSAKITPTEGCWTAGATSMAGRDKAESLAVRLALVLIVTRRPEGVQGGWSGDGTPALELVVLGLAQFFKIAVETGE